MALTVILQRTARDWNLPWTGPILRSHNAAKPAPRPAWPGQGAGVRPPVADETPLSEEEVAIGIEVGVLA